MKTKTDIENKILQTLDAFKSKLLSNIDAKRGYWCDETSEEGLQIICEGLEAFLIPFLDKPKDITKYIPLSDLKSEISRIYDVVSKEGFIATPYLDKDLKELGIDPPEFIDTVSYVLTCALHAKIILKDNNELDKETKEKIDYLIEKGINWIINTYIDKENEKGWAGFKPSESSLPHIYSTWSAIEALVSIFEYINESDESYPKELRDCIKRAKDILKDFKGWVLEFAKRQGNEWSDIMCLDIDIPTRTGVIYNIYGLNILYDIYEDGDKELLDLMIKELKKILEHWEFNKHRFIEDRFRSQRHRFIYQRSKRKLEKTLEYDDESILIVAIMVLSYILKRFESILSQVEYEEGINLKDALIGAIDQMIIELYNIYYKNGFCVDIEGKFSIYITERVVEALVAYAGYLGCRIEVRDIVEKLDALSEKMDEVFNQVVNSIESLKKEIKFVREHVESLSNIQEIVQKGIENIKQDITSAIESIIQDIVNKLISKELEKEMKEILSKYEKTLPKKSSKSEENKVKSKKES
jgi:archaellum component FlaC